MADNLYRSVQGVPYAPVATDLPAGLRSLTPELHTHVPPRLGRWWAIPFRLAVAAVCFAGGFLCARVFVDCLLRGAGACPCVMPPPPSPLALAIALVFLVAAPAVASTKFVSRGHPVLPPRVLSGLRQPLAAWSTST